MNFFNPCGKIAKVSMRATGGICVPTKHIPRRYFGFGEKLEGKHYAVITFEKSASARLALDLDGQELAGMELLSRYTVVR